MGRAKKVERPADRPPLGEVEEVPAQMGSRTENQVLLMQPFEVILAGKTHEIKLLPIRRAIAWRKKVVPLISGFLTLEGISTDTPEEFMAGMMGYLSDKPEEILDLFFEYACDLDRDEIEATATEWEVAAVFSQIAEAVIKPPLLTALSETLAGAIR